MSSSFKYQISYKKAEQAQVTQVSFDFQCQRKDVSRLDVELRKRTAPRSGQAYLLKPPYSCTVAGQVSTGAKGVGSMVESNSMQSIIRINIGSMET
jgi:hypothetical protein